ncbi:MAG: hypothetical protein K2Q06_02435 [Parvularculaceae bacterium]|nr:hypothetical protein [Parvularculaceae bacterium]
MHISEIMTSASIVAAIEAGEIWTPDWRRAFLQRVARNDPSTHAAFRLAPGNLTPARAASILLSDKSGGAKDLSPISALILREILRNCEDDDNRHLLRPWERCDDSAPAPDEGPRQPRVEKVKTEHLPMVTRFGVRIERLKICGFLNLRGFQMQRPLALKNCAFNRTLIISSAHIGALDLSGSCFTFEDDPYKDLTVQESKHLGKLREADQEAKKHALPGHFGDSYKDLVGLFARGARLSSATLKGVAAEFVNFNGAKIDGTVDFEGAQIVLPYALEPPKDGSNGASDPASREKKSGLRKRLWAWLRKKTPEHQAAQNAENSSDKKCNPALLERGKKFCESWRQMLHDAVSFNGARIGDLCIRRGAKVYGRVSLIDATASGLDFDSCEIHALPGKYGLGRAIYARSVTVTNRVDLGGREEIGGTEPESGLIFGRTRIYGQVYFVSARIGGNFRAYGVVLKRGLDAPFVLAEQKKVDSREVREEIRALVLRNARLGGSLLLGQKNKLKEKDSEAIFECTSDIDIRGASIDGDARFAACKLTHELDVEQIKKPGPHKRDPEWDVIDARGMDVRGALSLTQMDPGSAGLINLQEARAELYRDDFNFIKGRCIFCSFFTWLSIGISWLFVIVAEFIFKIVELSVYITTARFFSSEYCNRRLGPWDPIIQLKNELARHISGRGFWPKRLKFELLGFRYGSFQLRGEVGIGEEEVINRMHLSNGARTRWLKHQPREWLLNRFQPQPWVHGARVLRDLGYDAQSHDVLLHREKMALRSPTVRPHEKIVRLILITMCGHGHQMYLLAVWGVLFFAVGLMFNHVAVKANLVRPTSDNVLISDDYRNNGDLPTDYSTLSAVPFTLKRILPIPPLTGIEWAGCNWRQIRTSIVNKSLGACVPRSCQVAERPHAEPFDPDGRPECFELPVYVYDASRVSLFKHEDAKDVHSLEKGCRPKTAEERKTTLNLVADAKARGSAVYADLLCASPMVRDLLHDWTERINWPLYGVRPWVELYNGLGTLVSWFLLGATVLSGCLGLKLDHTPFMPIEKFDLVIGMNKFLSDGGLTEVNMILGFVGWLIWIILATYATGTLKRRE